ncbi:MAG: hypothetical protein B7Y36_01230 [Novosphingobium sp. 28-62-57]|uniref:RcnB family protein n=1 Tax=unclassified Novosphingobium TaxID=2644732 RepID=UPI000BC85664|nr:MULTISPECIES: RcnB family protein [unclassified Novosphingobium]OYW50043.1 MAG: hypothetical protein B7Z34_07240 [Novosphingobium sp. 12-62-10]OYZ12197.1 MAG: hypothetical protein B7Y36_01230 [Novosphingobium sp. 28-62-57]OZA40367.1 MAG: hypothetical protein B7X92_01620 [Novosphingobium sp. 17-62-9]HQS68956.1 RcnB family protein [Novosphingobium sp.]
MSGKSVFSKSALAILTFAMVTTAITPQAFAQERRERPEREARAGGGMGGGGNRGAGWSDGGMRNRGGDFGGRQQVQVQTRPQAQPQMPAPQQPRAERRSGGSWGGTVNSDGRARWNGGQRPATPPVASGTVITQSAPQGATPQRGWDGRQWNGTNPGRNNGTPGWRGNDDRTVNRDRDGRSDDRNWNRDRARNPAYANQDRNRDYRDRDRNDGRRDTWNGNNGRGNTWNNNNWRGNNWQGNGGRNAYQGDYRRWSNDWRRDNRYDWGRYRAVNRGIYRLPRYVSPFRGYNYSRLSVGIFLNSGFYGNNYWINDPWAYRLPPAYGPYRWVRYWDDVLLVDIYSGEVVDVISNFFW